MAIDYSSAPFALYVSDTGNNRVLIWKDSVHFQNGDPADLVIGQPSLLTGRAERGFAKLEISQRYLAFRRRPASRSIRATERCMWRIIRITACSAFRGRWRNPAGSRRMRSSGSSIS